MAYSATHHQCARSSSPLRFCPAVASALGVSEAIVLHRLDYWLGRTKHRLGGQVWVYNTYEAWQEQFPFWSVRTIQGIFRRLEALGVVESTQAHNRSRWDRTKWYTINRDQLAELVPETPLAAATNEAAAAAPSSDDAGAVEGTADAVIDDEASSSSWKTMRSSKDYSKKRSPKRAGEGEPSGEARMPALEDEEPVVTDCHHEKIVNDLDAAYEAIPETERETWLAKARRALADEGVAEYMQILPTVMERALRLWVGSTIPALAPG